MDHYDVIIVGTGAGGGTLAAHLAPSASGSSCSNAGLAIARAAELDTRRTFR